MEGLETESIHLELKYCERCGALWLRLQGSDALFCAGCARSMVRSRTPSMERAIQPREGPLGTAKEPATQGGVRADKALRTEVFWTEGGTA